MITLLKEWWRKFALQFRVASNQVPIAAIPNAYGQEAYVPEPPRTPPRAIPPDPPVQVEQETETHAEPEQQGEPPSIDREIKKRDTSYLHLRRDLARMAEYVLDRFEHLSKQYGDEYYSADLLGELWGCDFLMFDKEMGERMKGGDKWSVVEGVSSTELAQVIWPVDYAIAQEIDYHPNNPGIQLYRIYTVSPKDVRGKVVRIAPKMLRYIQGDFYDNGKWSICEGYMGLINGRWTLIHTGSDDYDVELKRLRHTWVRKIMMSIFTARYEWHVAFGTVPGGPRILFPTNPSAALGLFKNRDKDPGKTRRQMLKHWVEQHYRDTVADLSYVCNHLRGHTIFNWCGFGCELFVSEYDLEKNEVFKKEAKAWRAQRKHNRVRVHLKKGVAPDARTTMH
jgi:hypothetical protein